MSLKKQLTGVLVCLAASTLLLQPAAAEVVKGPGLQVAAVEEIGINTSRLTYDVSRFEVPEGTRLLVVTEGFAVKGGRDTYREGYVTDESRWNRVRVTAFLRETDDMPFAPVVQTAGVMGWSGMKNDRVPGDGSTPIGFFRMNTPFGRQPAEEGFPENYVEISKEAGTQYWSDTTNRLETSTEFAEQNGERLYESWAETIYDYCIDMGFNREAKPHVGSALFMHCTKPGKPSTAGCVAIDAEAMKSILRLSARGDTVCALAPAGEFEAVYSAFSEEGRSPEGSFPASTLELPQTRTTVLR